MITHPKTRRKVFTAETDMHGSLVVERLPAGPYVVHSPGGDLKPEINARGDGVNTEKSDLGDLTTRGS